MITQNCNKKKLGDEVRENWQKVEEMENELDCDSNDWLSLFSVFTVRSFKLNVYKHLHCFLQMYDDTFNPLGVQGGRCTSSPRTKCFCNFRSSSVKKISFGTFSSQNYTPLKLLVMWINYTLFG